MSDRPIIVLTPIKNEEWIIGPFLEACSVFADHIILLFQDTDDASREIAMKFPKAVIVENTSNEYSERSRIIQLLDAARRIVPSGAVLIALDADEIPLHLDRSPEDWQAIRHLESAQNISFKKPDLLPDGETIVDLNEDWNLGFVDDGRNYETSEVHAQRVPIEPGKPVHVVEHTPVLHINLVRERVNRAKRRMYCVIENTKSLQPLRRRLLNYHRNRDFTLAAPSKGLPDDWRKALLNLPLDPTCIPEEEPFWQDREVLRHFNTFGEARYYWDDIWDADWEHIRQACLNTGETGLPETPVARPSFFIDLIRRLTIRLLLIANSLRQGKT